MAFGTIKKQKNGKYRVWWSFLGKRYSKVLGTSYKEAQTFLAHKQIECNGIAYSCTYDTYWETVVYPSFKNLEPHTVDGYVKSWKKLQPMIGGTLVDRTTLRKAEAVLHEIKAPSAQKKAYVLWKKICNMAVTDGLLQSCPITKNINLDKANKKQKTLYKREDIQKLLEEIRGIKYEPLILLEVGGGLRHEEAIAVCGRDITTRTTDRTYAVVSINKAIVSVSGKKYLKDTKNKYSERIVVIGSPFAERLLELSEKEGPIVSGLTKGDGSLVEHYASPITVSHNWKSWNAHRDLPYVPFGNMRSCYATLLGEAGALDSLVSMAMGHSGTTTKSAHYQQSTLKGLEIVADCYTDYLA